MLQYKNVGGNSIADLSRPVTDMDNESTWRFVDHLGTGGFSNTQIT